MQYVLYENIYKNKNELTDTDGAENPQSNLDRDNPSPTNVNVESKWNIVNDNIFTLRNKIDSLFQTIQVLIEQNLDCQNQKQIHFLNIRFR